MSTDDIKLFDPIPKKINLLIWPVLVVKYPTGSEDRTIEVSKPVIDALQQLPNNFSLLILKSIKVDNMLQAVFVKDTVINIVGEFSK